jgi:hypothetical protein
MEPILPKAFHVVTELKLHLMIRRSRTKGRASQGVRRHPERLEIEVFLKNP